jgi:hypothetical protein
MPTKTRKILFMFYLKTLKAKLIISMKQNSPWEAESFSAIQLFPRIL